MMGYICEHNKGLDVGDDDYLSPFDFILEEDECKEANELVPDFESAKKVIGPTRVILVKSNTSITEFNARHIDALNALNRLFTIAEAWNIVDGFVPDFSDWNQDKWFPWFKYDKDAAGFVCAYTCNAPTSAGATFGPRVCFKSSERAAQFGKQFANLYNKVFL